MPLNHKKINRIGRFVVDSMLVMLLWTILALPASSFSLLKIAPQTKSNVLSGQDKRPAEIINPKDVTKSVREIPQSTSTSPVQENIEVEESTPSSEITP
jgi:hypothetical protein